MGTVVWPFAAKVDSFMGFPTRSLKVMSKDGHRRCGRAASGQRRIG
jgi:hypothetical protein